MPRRARSLCLALTLALCAACSKAPSPSSASPGPAPAQPEAAPRLLTVSTRSATARKALERALQYLDDRRNPEALAELSTALEADPDFALAHAYLARNLPVPAGPQHAARAEALLSGLPEVERVFIEAHLASARGDDVRARELRTRAVALAPEDHRTHFELAEQLYDEGRFEEAVQGFERTLALNPASSAHNGLGYSLAALGRLDEAVVALRRYVEVRPKEPNPRDSLGEVALFAGKYEEAEASFLKATELSPRFWGAWNGVAQARFFRGDFGRGFEALQRAKEAAPTDLDRVKVHGYRAWAALATGNMKGAIAALDDMERDCADKKLEAQAANAAILRAAILVELGQHEQALRWTTIALERLKRAPMQRSAELALRRRTLIRKVLAEAALGRIPEAEKTLSVLLEDGKRSGLRAESRWGIRLARGMIALGKGDTQGAVAELSLCDLGANAFSYTFASQPEVPYCVFQLAQVLDRTGDAAGATRARQALQRANLRDPSYTYLRARVERELKTSAPAPPPNAP